MKLSIIVPVFNENKTILEILKRVGKAKIPGFTKEIIVVDDGSTDKTVEKIKNQTQKFKFIQHKKNLGKGSAVLSGIKIATGDYIIIQDADLEYDPNQIQKLTKTLVDEKSQVVYGTRLNRAPNLKRDEKTLQFLIHYFGNRFLSLLTSVLYGQWITDIETCYKLFSKKAIKSINLKARGFEFEPEITSKFLKKGYKILEIPITTNPRGYNEGKKLNTVRDGLIAFLTLLRYRFFD